MTISTFPSIRFKVVLGEAMAKLALFFALAFLASAAQCKVWNKCDLADYLYTYQGSHAVIDGDDRRSCHYLSNWLCLVEHESNYNDQAVNDQNSNGSSDYGLYQINNYFWCTEAGATTNNDCNIDCAQLHSGDILDDTACTDKIFDIHGFDAWYGWKDNCKHCANGGCIDEYLRDCSVRTKCF